MPKYNVLIQELPTGKDKADYKPVKVLVQGSFETFKQLELALERGLKCSVIPKKKAPAKKAPAKKKAKK